MNPYAHTSKLYWAGAGTLDIISMTACAWLCRARMAGPSVYFGELVDKPRLGPPEDEAAPWDKVRLLALCALMRHSAACGGLLLWLVCLVPGLLR